MGEMSWRITNEQEFYKRANHYIANHVEKFMKGVKERYASDPRKIHDIKSKYDAYIDMSNDDLQRKIHAGLMVVLNDVDNWKNFSGGTSTSLDEIMLRGLISNIFNCSYVCSLFISRNHNLSEKFIEDYIYATSYLFNFEEWDDKHVKAVTSCAASGEISNKCKELLELYDKNRLTDKPIIIKIDLSEISLFNKSEEFIKKYDSLIDPNKKDDKSKEKEEIL